MTEIEKGYFVSQMTDQMRGEGSAAQKQAEPHTRTKKRRSASAPAPAPAPAPAQEHGQRNGQKAEQRSGDRVKELFSLGSAPDTKRTNGSQIAQY